MFFLTLKCLINKKNNIQIYNMTEIPKLTFNNRPKNIGCCGLKNKKQIYFPFFLMGCCGDEKGVISWNGEREILSVPKKMDYKWFKKVADKLKGANRFYDWDWESFSKNILRPNKEHLKMVLKLNDDDVETFLRDGYVFINHFEDTPEDDGDYTTEEWEEARLKGEVGYFCNFKNFLEHPNGVEY